MRLQAVVQKIHDIASLTNVMYKPDCESFWGIDMYHYCEWRGSIRASSASGLNAGVRASSTVSDNDSDIEQRGENCLDEPEGAGWESGSSIGRSLLED
jgi:hypothetical protein